MGIVEMPDFKCCVLEPSLDDVPPVVIARFHFVSDAMNFIAHANKVTKNDPKYSLFITVDDRILEDWNGDDIAYEIVKVDQVRVRPPASPPPARVLDAPVEDWSPGDENEDWEYNP